MSNEATGTVTCGEAVAHLVETGGQPTGNTVDAHVRSCMSCFRAMTELRDLPRVADALRAAAPVAPAPDDRFWDALALRTTDAAARALAGGGEAGVLQPVSQAGAPARTGRRRFGASKPSSVYAFGALAMAAAAGWVVMVHRPVAPAGTTTAAPAAQTASLSQDEGGAEALGDVAELDSTALHRLLDRLGRNAPAALAGGARLVGDRRDATDLADIPADDEPRVSDEVADLDGDALRRVESSLHGASL
ncbi:MAG TPA: hypothetical protein VHM31_04090 [Polyangia bacterium]|nr:hypothetical protein [Polyangia bacterium]